MTAAAADLSVEEQAEQLAQEDRERAEQLVWQGYGIEDVKVKLQISRELAKWFVFRQGKQKKK